MGTWYWSIVALALGGCIGSFLNVVIYRGARGMSVHQPARSFCPHCRKSIAWYDNIPVISYLLLRARCRQCGAPISLQYPIVELATAFVFLMTYDAFFEGRLRLGIGGVPNDAIMLVAHWALFAGLIALAVMDLEAYMVDIRITWLLTLVGLVAHAAWTPDTSAPWIRPGPVQAAWVAATAIGLGLGVWWALRREGPLPEEPQPADVETSAAPEGGLDASSPEAGSGEGTEGARSWRWLWLVLPIGLVVAYFVLLLDDQGKLISARTLDMPPATVRLLGGLALLFVGLTLAASCPQPEVDTEIVEAIESEAPDARRMALWELKLLAPAIGLFVLAVLAMTRSVGAQIFVQDLLDWRALGDWRPLLGLSTGLAGWIIGGAIAWLARIFFTLAFGKEALGMGDVHILAAAGAIAGWPVALLAFFLSAILALGGMLVILLRRQSRALPYGPWLGLGCFLAAMFQDRIFEYAGVRWLFQ